MYVCIYVYIIYIPGLTEKAPLSKQLVRIKLRLKTKMKTLLKHGPQTHLRDGAFTTD